MRILITGAQGQVGQALIANAIQQKIDFFAFSKDTLDITSPPMVTTTLKQVYPDVVINAAAYTNVEQAEDFPEQALQINSDAVGLLARACSLHNIPLLHISTDYVFSGTQRKPYVESDETEPGGMYGASKVAGEKQLMAFAKKIIILRSGWVFSATGHNFVKTMWRLFHEKTTVSVVNDQWGAPTSANALAKILLTIAARTIEPDFCDWGIFHYSGAPALSWYDFACAIQQACFGEPLVLQQLLAISSSEFPTKTKRPTFSVLELKKIKNVFGIDPCDWKKDLIKVIEKLKNLERV